MKKNLICFGLMIILFLTLVPYNVKAQESVKLYLFYGAECPHCEQEIQYLNTIRDKYDNLEIIKYEVWHNTDNSKLMMKVKQYFNITSIAVPFTIIGDKKFSGYDPYNYPNEFEKYIEKLSNEQVKDVVLAIKNGETLDPYIELDQEHKPVLDVPIIGKVDTKDLSLPVLTLIMGLLDGLNPCAMWVLLFLISMMISMNDRKRMWVLGMTFIITSGLIYLLFMLAWLNVTAYINTIVWFRLIIALIAISGGIINLYSYLKSRKDNGCLVVNDKKRTFIFSKIKKYTSEKVFLIALLGIMLLAIIVNVVELACSAGLPVVFTSILRMNNLPFYQYLSYILLYILFFLIDDIIVFVVAVSSMKLMGISTKYGKLSHLIGGLLMFIIGLLLIFKPAWIMFNF